MKSKLINTQSTAGSTVNSTRFIKVGVLASSLLASLIIASSAPAASACKGLDNSACSASISCGWVESYQRKDGRTVKAFCRTNSGAKKAQASKVTKQAQKSVAKNGR